MIKIMFVCHGNICRSPMAEFVMLNLVDKAGKLNSVKIASSATSYEEIGNEIYYAAAKKLEYENIPYHKRTAVIFTKDDYNKYDYIIGMDDNNIRNILRIIGTDSQQKVLKLLDFCGGGNVADPWYTGDFDRTFYDISRGCSALMEKLQL